MAAWCGALGTVPPCPGETNTLKAQRIALGLQAWSPRGGSVQGGWWCLDLSRAAPSRGWRGQRWPLQLQEGRAWLPCSFPKLLPEKSDRAWVLGVGRAGPGELATCLPPRCSASFCTRTSVLCTSPSGPELPPSHRLSLSESPGQTAGRLRPHGAGSTPGRWKLGLWSGRAPPPAHRCSKA